MMNRGHLLAVDDPNVLREIFPHIVIELVAKPRRPAVAILRENAEVSHVEAFGERLHVFVPRGVAAPGEVSGLAGDEAITERDAAAEKNIELTIEDLRSQGISVSSCRRVTPSLEDVFIASISEEEQEQAAERLNEPNEVSA